MWTIKNKYVPYQYKWLLNKLWHTQQVHWMQMTRDNLLSHLLILSYFILTEIKQKHLFLVIFIRWWVGSYFIQNVRHNIPHIPFECRPYTAAILRRSTYWMINYVISFCDEFRTSAWTLLSVEKKSITDKLWR